MPAARLLAALAIALIPVATGLLYVSMRNSAVTLSLRLRAGSTYTFRVSSTTASTPDSDVQGTTLEETLIWQVSDLATDGTATLALEASDQTIDGTPAGSPAGGEIQVSSDGRVVLASARAMGSGSSAAGLVIGFDQLTPVLPTGPVKPGATWSSDYEQAVLEQGGIHYTAESSFLRYEDLNGVRDAVIQTRLSAPIDLSIDWRKALVTLGLTPEAPQVSPSVQPKIVYSGRVEYVLTGWLDPKTGSLEKSTANGSYDLTITYDGFPTLFGNFQPSPSRTLPFGGGPTGGSSSEQDTRHATATIEVTMDLIP
jgi:hypothetical protein